MERPHFTTGLCRADLPEDIQRQLDDVGAIREVCAAIYALSPEHATFTLCMGLTQDMVGALFETWMDETVPLCTFRDYLLILSR